MRIVRFRAENLKRLKVVEITPEGALVQITGANGAGKSSILDAIMYALAGKKAIDPVPVRRGADEAVVELDLGRIRVRRIFDKEGGTSVSVTAEDGARYSSPQTMLDALLGAFTFDPLEFTRMDAAARSTALRKLVDINVDFAKIDQQNQVDFRVRTDVNRKVKELRARLDAIPKPEGDIPEQIDVAQLVADMRAASEHNAVLAQKAAQLDNLNDRVRRGTEHVEQMRRDLARAEQTLAAIVAERDALHREGQEAPPPIDTRKLENRIEEAHHHNRTVAEIQRVIAERSRLEQDLALEVERAHELTGFIDARNQEKADAIAAAKMPIEGLTFGDDLSVKYNGLPFEQASSAEQLRVSVAIAMAMNPKLRVLRIKDGSLLDETNLAAIAQMAEEGDYQIWIERVDTSGKIGVVIEDGEVREPEPVEV